MSEHITALIRSDGKTAEQWARDLMEACGWDGAQSCTAGDVVFLANVLREVRPPAIGFAAAEGETVEQLLVRWEAQVAWLREQDRFLTGDRDVRMCCEEHASALDQCASDLRAALHHNDTGARRYTLEEVAGMLDREATADDRYARSRNVCLQDAAAWLRRTQPQEQP